MSPFRFLDLPDELRLKLYRFILPHGERLHLDPNLVIFPIPYIIEESYEESYGTTRNLLRVCKKIHVEATQFIYRHNTVNVIGTTESGNFLRGLGPTACEYITKLECHVREGLGDLGNIWETMHHCPRLGDLRVVFYHELVNWSRTLAQLACYLQNTELEEGLQDLDVELHSSIWAPRYTNSNYAAQFQTDLTRAQREAKVFSFKIPNQLRHITITASVRPIAAEVFAGWRDESGLWEFRSFSKNDNEMKKTMRFAKIQEE